MTIQLKFEKTKQRELIKLLERLKELGWVSSYNIERSASASSQPSKADDEAIESQIESLLPSNPNPLSAKAKTALEKIDSFQSLKPGWDGYDADTVSEVAMAAAKKFIEKADHDGLITYFTAPGRSGEVLVEFKLDGKAVEIYFEPDGKAEALFFENDECVTEGSLDENYEKLISFLHAKRD
jgi:hypothetical protein